MPALVAAAGAGIVVGLWGTGGVADIHDTRDAAHRPRPRRRPARRLPGARRAAAARAAAGARPAGRASSGSPRGTAANGAACLSLLLAHAVLITAGYTLGDGISLPAEVARLITGYPGRDHGDGRAGAARRRRRDLVARGRAPAAALRDLVLRAPLRVPRRSRSRSATSSRPGTDFVGRAGRARLLVRALRRDARRAGGLPPRRPARAQRCATGCAWSGSSRRRPASCRSRSAACGLDRLRARAGQFFTWRFLTRDRWWEAHPFSLSAAPDGRRLRITVKGVGDYTAGLRAIPPGTRVIAEGPFGSFTPPARRRPRVALIAGGVGITPIRALLEDMPGEPGDIAVVYRALRAGRRDPARRARRARARRRGAELHYVLGDHATASCSPPSTCSGSCPTSPSATSTCAARRR